MMHHEARHSTTLVARSGAARYGLAVAATAGMVALRLGLDPVLQDGYPFITLFAATALASVVGGRGPGVLAAALGYLAVSYLFIDPRGAIVLRGAEDVTALGAYSLTSGIIIVLSYYLRRARETARTRGAEAVQEVARREAVEAEVRRLNEDLERRILERTGDLERANVELEAYSHSVSHDLRAPLRAICSYAELLAEDLGGDATGEAALSIERIRAGCDRMAKLIDSLLKLSRIGRIELRHERVDLSTAARKVTQELREADRGRTVEVRVEEGLEAQGDPELLGIALTNLIGNAWKFTGKTAQPKVEVGRVPGGAETVFFVRDNGAGFDASSASKLFTPFQRYHPLGEFDGSGIGLATVARVIQRHGGRVWAEAKPGQGATFFFTVAKK